MRILATLLIALAFGACQSEESGLNEKKENESKEPSPEISLEGVNLDELVLPDGFEIKVFARVSNARSMVLGEKGTLFVGNRNAEAVYAVVDSNGDFVADKVYKIDDNLTMPNGVAFKDGSLYVAEVSRLLRYDNIEDNLENPGEPVVVYDDLPTDRHHGWKYIAFGPDGKLYVPVGAPCNICESKNEVYASIMRMDADGSNREIVAKGVRNTVGFTWHPQTNELWFTDNGRDVMGDNLPPCELNRVSNTGQHFGYPYCHGGTIKDPEFGDKFPCEDFVQPAQNLGPHVAPLGLKFYTGNMFPDSFKNSIFIAEHGSWNRSPEAGHTGHQITMVKESNGVGTSYEPFITGFLNKSTNRAWGRPVDILILDDGSMLISDDLSGTIYRVTHKG